MASLPLLLWIPEWRGTLALALPESVFLPLHTVLACLFGVVALFIFFIGWYCFHRADSGEAFHALIGMAFLFVGLMDFLHAFSYPGMPAFFTPNHADRALAFWMAARFMEVTGLFVALFVHRRGLPARYPTLSLAVISLLLAGTVSLIFLAPPDLFHAGPTLSAIWIEGGLLLGYLLNLLYYLRSFREEGSATRLFILTSLLFSVYAELSFLNHRSMIDVLSLVGYLYKGLATLLLFRAVVVSGLMLPYQKLEQALSLYRQANLQAQTDQMTGLLNHGCFKEHLNRQFQEARRYGRPLSLIMIDLDFFKRINDTYGHPAGDEILMRVADAVRGTTRDCDYPSRYGGEELAILLPETTEEQARVLAERLRRQIMSIKHGMHEVTASFGVAQIEDVDGGGDDLLARADQALYLAKKTGRNRVCGTDRLAV